MNSRVATYALLVGLVFCLIILSGRVRTLNLPPYQQGYEPVQPIAFSHRLHAGEMEIGCLYCHFGAEKSRYAGIPPANVCMNCHRVVTATLGALRQEDDLAKKEGRQPRVIVSPELAKLYDALGLNAARERDPKKPRTPIHWVQVHNLPDFVYFDHRPHLSAGVACDRCHGPVETMERVRQYSDLSMGWCVNCHREANRTATVFHPVHASTNCMTCHY